MVFPSADSFVINDGGGGGEKSPGDAKDVRI
jgi:hypothetical protein